MRVLVTGSSGLLGSACCDVLKSRGHEVLTTSRVDLRSVTDTFWALNGLSPDAIIHCAARVGGVKANRDNPVEFLEDNLAINSNVIKVAHMIGVKKLINIGTSCLYPKNAPVPVKEESLLTGPFEPDVEAYAVAKLAAYSLCKAYSHQYGRNYVTVCPANLYGPGDNYGPSGHVLPSLIRKAFDAKRLGGPIKVWGDGSAVREFLYSRDAAEAIVTVLESDTNYDLVNIGTGVGTTIWELAGTIASIVGVNEIKWQPSEPTGIQRKTFDISRITELGWSPKTKLNDGILLTCKDFIENPSFRNQ